SPEVLSDAADVAALSGFFVSSSEAEDEAGAGSGVGSGAGSEVAAGLAPFFFGLSVVCASASGAAARRSISVANNGTGRTRKRSGRTRRVFIRDSSCGDHAPASRRRAVICRPRSSTARDVSSGLTTLRQGRRRVVVGQGCEAIGARDATLESGLPGRS